MRKRKGVAMGHVAIATTRLESAVSRSGYGTVRRSSATHESCQHAKYKSVWVRIN